MLAHEEEKPGQDASGGQAEQALKRGSDEDKDRGYVQECTPSLLVDSADFFRLSLLFAVDDDARFFLLSVHQALGMQWRLWEESVSRRDP